MPRESRHAADARTAPKAGALPLQPKEAAAPPALSPPPPPPVLSPQSVHPAQDGDFPFGWELKKEVLALPPAVLPSPPTPNAAVNTRICCTKSVAAIPSNSLRAAADHPARSPAHPDDPRHLLAADHHPAEGLAATGTSACDRRG